MADSIIMGSNFGQRIREGKLDPRTLEKMAGNQGLERVLRGGGVEDETLQLVGGMTNAQKKAFSDRIKDFARGLIDAESAAKVLEGISKRNRKAAGEQRRAAEDMELAMLKATVSLRNAIKNAEALSSGRRGITDLRTANANQLNLATMSGGVGVLSPFLSREASLDYGNRSAMAEIRSQTAAKRASAGSTASAGVLGALSGGIFQVGERQNRFLKGLRTGGSQADIEHQETLQEKVGKEFDAVANIFTRMQGMAGGMGGRELIKRAISAVEQDATLKDDNEAAIAVQTHLLESLQNLAIKTDANLATIAVEAEHSNRLQTLQNQFAKESLNIERNLERQGGISEFRSGPLASLAKIDSIQTGRNAVNSSPFNKGIRGAQQSFREAEFLQNYFGQRNIPEPIINTAIGGRAAQMAQMAREAKARGGVLGAGITDEMMTVEGNLQAAEDQVRSSLKGGIPERLESIRSQIEDAERGIVESQEDKFGLALKKIFNDNYGTDSLKALNTIANLRDQEKVTIEKNQAANASRGAANIIRSEVNTMLSALTAANRVTGNTDMVPNIPSMIAGKKGTPVDSTAISEGILNNNDPFTRAAQYNSLVIYLEAAQSALKGMDGAEEELARVNDALSFSNQLVKDQIDEYDKYEKEVNNATTALGKLQQKLAGIKAATGGTGTGSGPAGMSVAQWTSYFQTNFPSLFGKSRFGYNIPNANAPAGEPSAAVLAAAHERERRKRQQQINATSSGNLTMRQMVQGMGHNPNQFNLSGLQQGFEGAMGGIQSHVEGASLEQNTLQIAEAYKQQMRVQEHLKKALDATNKASVTYEQRTRAIANAFKKANIEGRFARGEMSGREFADASVASARAAARDGTFDPRGGTMDLVRSQFAYTDIDKMEDYQRLVVETARTFKSEFKSAFRSFIDGSKSSKEAFRGFAMSILDRITDITTDMAFDTLFGGLLGTKPSGMSRGGRVGRYSQGGFVNMGGSGVRDDVPAMLTEGEFVVNAKAARQNAAILSAINTGRGYQSGGSISSLIKNRFDYDDEKRPTTGVMNVSDKLSLIGQEDTLNPQNRKKFERQDAFFAYRKQEHDREERNRKAREDFEKERSGKLMMGVLSSVINMAPGVMGAMGGNFAKVGSFLGSTGGMALTSAGLGAVAGGGRGAIMGGIAGATAGVMKNRVAPELAKQRAKTAREDLAMKAVAAARAQEMGVALKQEKKKSFLGSLFSTPKHQDHSFDRHAYYQEMFRKAGGKGKAKSFNSGGLVNGLFGGNTSSDNVPAMLTEGEYVVNRQAAAMNMNLLKAINGGKVRGYAEGGYVTSDAMSRDTGSEILGTGAGGAEISESILQLIEEVRSVKSVIEDQTSQQELDRQSGNNLGNATSPNNSGPSNVTNNINISVSMDDAGGATAQTTVSPQAEQSEMSDSEAVQDRIERERELAEKIKNGAISVIQDEQRPGGLLYQQGGFR